MKKMITAAFALLALVFVTEAGPRRSYHSNRHYGYSRPVYSVRTSHPVVIGDKAVSGGLLGAGAGALIAEATDHDAGKGALIGGMIGLLTGSGMDRRETYGSYDYERPYYSGRSYSGYHSRYYAPQYQPRPQPTLVRVVRCYNSNGTSFEVRLRHLGGDQWQGPRGEVYHYMPSAQQLRRRYARSYRW
jgi:hypothetical protein